MCVSQQKRDYCRVVGPRGLCRPLDGRKGSRQLLRLSHPPVMESRANQSRRDCGPVRRRQGRPGERGGIWCFGRIQGICQAAQTPHFFVKIEEVGPSDSDRPKRPRTYPPDPPKPHPKKHCHSQWRGVCPHYGGRTSVLCEA